jgi:hypothetical protein
VLVADRGTAKNQQVQDITEYGFHHITATAKAGVESLLDQGATQMTLFDQLLTERIADEGGSAFVS